MNKSRIEISRQDVLLTLLKLPLRKYMHKLSNRYIESNFPQLAIYSYDYIGITIAIDGVYEIRELDLIKSFLEEYHPNALEGVCLDIGANIGNHSVYFSKLFNKVRSFEPNPYPFKLLRINTENYKNIHISNFGLSDQRCSATFFTSKSNIGGSSLHNESGDEIQVQLEILDELNFNKENISFIKIDVEGNELQVLKGGEGIFKKHSPIVAFEQHSHEFLQGESLVIKKLRSFGYTSFYCTEASPTYIRAWMPFKNIIRLIHQLIFGGQKLLIKYDRFKPNFYPLIIAVK
jgi:FkbM family methyltransferase